MNKHLLLDSHVFLWLKSNPTKIGPETKNLIFQAEEIFVSSVSAWELTIKANLGKLSLPEPVSAGIQKSGFRALPLTMYHAEAITQITIAHKDPFDRLLLATARTERLTLVTADEKLVSQPDTFDARR